MKKKNYFYSMQLISADAFKIFFFFFAHEIIKKRPQKLLIIGLKLFFHVLARIDLSYHKNVPRLICSLICDSWSAITLTIFFFKSKLHCLSIYGQKDPRKAIMIPIMSIFINPSSKASSLSFLELEHLKAIMIIKTSYQQGTRIFIICDKFVIC